MTRRTIVLLGAGASRDAGLPLTSQLAERVVANLNTQSPGTPLVQALNFVYSQMVGHQGEDGSNPLRAVNIETLISAVRLLQSRESHEVAPFVSAWKAGALGFSRAGGLSPSYSRSARSAVQSAITDRNWGGDDLVKLIGQIAVDVGRPKDDTAFVALEAALLQGIRAELTEVSSVDYLRPLAELAGSQEGGLDVVTLNYDRTIETMAAQAGMDLDTGIQRWIPGVPFSFERVDGRINLYKLHGSVDWELVKLRPEARSVVPPKIEVMTSGLEIDDRHPQLPLRSRSGDPWIVVGDREKLATDGPTLDLLHAASEAFAQADSLVVVGYSFADAHINAMIRNWMAAGAERTMTVVDPAWPLYTSDEPRGHFAMAYGVGGFGSGPEPRISVIADTAANGLTTALGPFPTTPERYAEAVWSTDPTAGEVVVHLLGPSLTNVSVHAYHGGGNVNVLETREGRDELVSRPLAPNSWRSARLGRVATGDEFSVFPVVPAGAESIRLALEGDDFVGHRRIELDVAAIPPGTPTLGD